MEKVPNLENVLEEIESINKNGGEYLRLFIDMTSDYDVEPFLSNPQFGMNCFTNGLEDDISELIDLFSKDSEPQHKTELTLALRHLHEMLEGKNFSRFALQPLFDKYLIRDKSTADVQEEGNHQRYYAPNLVLDKIETERFFIACGLTQNTTEGKGSHTKWFDSKGKFVQTSYTTDKRWLKKIISTLLENGISLNIIQKACEKLKIEFRIAN